MMTLYRPLNAVVAQSQNFPFGTVNDERNAQVFNLFICLLVPYMFRAKRKPETWKAEVNRPNKNLCIMLVIVQFHSKMHGPYNIKYAHLELILS
jgi:hypothetical protein